MFLIGYIVNTNPLCPMYPAMVLKNFIPFIGCTFFVMLTFCFQIFYETDSATRQVWWAKYVPLIGIELMYLKI